MRITIDPERPDPRRLQPAITALQQGEVIIYPTDTGYAFGCALSSSKGITTLRKLKGISDRHAKPLTMMVKDIADIGRYTHMSNPVFRVLRRLLPGPYTIVLAAGSDVPRAMKNRAHEVGIRIPAHATCTLLVEKLGEPLVGSVTPGESEPELEEPEVLDRRHHDVALVIDGGPLWPQPSTVLRCIEGEIEVLRVGQGPVPEL